MHLEGKGHSDYRRRSGDRGAMARLFASEGATVALLDLTESQGPAVADGILRESAEALFIPADVRSQAGVAEVIRTTRQTFGRLDVVVNVAGFNRKGHVDSPSVEDPDSVMEGTFRTCSDHQASTT